MKAPGQIVILPFPHTNFSEGKLRPALLLSPLPGGYDDWLACMISSKLHQTTDIDEVIDKTDPDFLNSGLKIPSVIRATRLMVVSNDLLVGALGQISSEKLQSIRKKLSSWIMGE